MNAGVLLAPHAGIASYVKELGRAFNTCEDVEITYVYGFRSGPDFPQQGLGHYSLLRNTAKRLLPSSYRLKRWIEASTLKNVCRKACADLYHEPTLWPHRLDRPTVMTLHDLTHIYHPETQPQDRLRAIDKTLPYALEHAAQIICVSESTAAQAISYYGINPERISITPLGVSSRFRPYTSGQSHALLQSLGLSYRGFILCVGTLEPRKNLELVFGAIKQLSISFLKKYPIILCGSQGWGSVSKTLERLERQGLIRRVGYLPEMDLCLLLSAARMLVFPSLYEGFGLPVVEAMASGTPVITSNCSAMPEVGGDAVMYINPHDSAELANAIQLLEADTSVWHEKRDAGLERAKNFNWKHTAALTKQAYKKSIKDT